MTQSSTHSWARAVDAGHLARIRRDPAEFAPGGVRHLVLEVVAYAADEAAGREGGRCAVTLRRDGSVSVRDNGRGTATVRDEAGRAIRKPVMTTKDLRFFDFPDAQTLPDGQPRRGISVVAALSDWLVHTNRRQEGAWTQRYEHGVPVTGLVKIEGDGTTGTTVRFLAERFPAERFLADEPLRAAGWPTAAELALLAAAWPELAVDVDDERAS